MTFPRNEYGTPTMITASGTSVITSGNASLLGFTTNSGTPGTINFYHGTSTGSIIASGILAVTGTFVRVPAYCSGGLTVLLTGWTTPCVTFYWSNA